MAAALMAGCYERRVLGFSLKAPPREIDGSDEVQAGALPVAYNYGAHLGPVKSVAASGFVAASGGDDDVIKLYDLKGRTDMGTLMQHEGSVTSLQFHGPQGHPTHLISGGEDSKICVWDTDKWQHLITLKGHKGPINDISVHPSGRLALSVSRDGTLRMWNLVKGKSSFSSKLPQEGLHVALAPQGGDTYALGLQGGLVTLHASENGREIRQLKHADRVLALASHLDRLVVTAGEEGTIRAWDNSVEEPVLTIPKAHSSRIRGLAVPPGLSHTPLPLFLASASSDGVVRTWDPRMLKKKGSEEGSQGSMQPWLEVATKARITCMALGGFWAKKSAEISGTSVTLHSGLPKEAGGGGSQGEEKALTKAGNQAAKARKRDAGDSADTGERVSKRQMKSGKGFGSGKADIEPEAAEVPQEGKIQGGKKKRRESEEGKQSLLPLHARKRRKELSKGEKRTAASEAPADDVTQNLKKRKEKGFRMEKQKKVRL